jgi:hypothetical protein
MFLGDYTGELKLLNIGGEFIDVHKVGDNAIWSIDMAPQDRFVLVGCPFGQSKMFSLDNFQTPLQAFREQIGKYKLPLGP